MKGLRPHTHEEGMTVAHGLVPLLRRKFGDGLRAVAVSASVARGEDRAYSDLELVVFLRDPPREGEDAYLQRIVDGMLVEAEYVTEDAYLQRFAEVTPVWYLAASDVLLPIHGAELFGRITAHIRSIRHPRERLLRQASRRFVEVQESGGKVLNALQAATREAVGLLLWDFVHHTLVTLAFLNERPFTTFARFIPEARAFPLKPARYDELLDRMVDGDWRDFGALWEVVEAVFTGMEALFVAEGVALYDESVDPDHPNGRG